MRGAVGPNKASVGSPIAEARCDGVCEGECLGGCVGVVLATCVGFLLERTLAPGWISRTPVI